jgi:6-phosphogluconolactonase
MKTTLLMLFFTTFLSCSSKEKIAVTKLQKKAVSFYVGTYTNAESKGIYKYTLQENGDLKKIGLVAPAVSPSFLAKSNDEKTLFTVNETNVNQTGTVTAYAIEKDTLKIINQQKSGGAHPCFIIVNPKGQVLVANYTGGSVGLLQANAHGELSELVAIQQHTGKGITARQEAPHAHSTWFHPTKNEIISVDLGTNQLLFSKLDSIENKLTFSKPTTLNMAAGAGPRHLEFHPNHKWIYVLNELNNTISLVKEHKKSYTIDSSISMLPKDFKEYSSGADIHISKDGKFLYASNRGHNSIVIYQVNQENGQLKVVNFQPTLGKTPRNFSLSPDNNYLLVANQDTNTIVSFKRDSSSGRLKFVSTIEAPTPVCILF